MPYNMYAECPCCKLQTNNYEDIVKYFGFRTMNDGRKIKLIPQSYCRKCRCSGCTKKQAFH